MFFCYNHRGRALGSIQFASDPLIPVCARPHGAHPRRRVRTSAARERDSNGLCRSPSRACNTTLARAVERPDPDAVFCTAYGDKPASDRFRFGVQLSPVFWRRAHARLMASEIHLITIRLRNDSNIVRSRLLRPSPAVRTFKDDILSLFPKDV